MTTGENFTYRIRRDTRGAIAWFRENYRQKRWFRWASIALLAVAVCVVRLVQTR